VGKRKVLILGGGIAALTTGIELLEDGGGERYEVTLACMEHRLGGKASSWRHADGRLMEIGFHAIFGYYSALRDLLARVGRPTTDPAYFTSNGGEHLIYEPSARAVNRLRVPRGPLDVGAIVGNLSHPYHGMSASEGALLGNFAARMGAYFLRHAPEDIDPAIDEISFTEFCLARGLPLELTRKAWFKYVLDLCFNYPAPGSAYVGVYGFRKLLGYDAAEVLYLNGGISEIIVEPLARRFALLGGRVELGQKAVGLTLDPAARAVTEVALREVSEGGTPGEERALRRGADFDVVVSTLPVDSLRTLLRTVPDFERAVLDHAYLRRIWHLRTVASLSMRVWSPRRLLPRDFTTVVMGTPQPMATIIDYANRVDELRGGPYASVLEFEGQEGLHGDLTNAELRRLILEQFAELPFSLLRRAWIPDILEGRSGFHCELRRNTAEHHRYLLMEPGHWKHRPETEGCPYPNLLLAGDWLKSAQPTASMEAAVRSGQKAAAQVELS